MAGLEAGTPLSRGFKMLAEWETHEGTWLGWPQNPADWPGKFAAIPWVYAEIVRLLSQHENVHILVNSEVVKSRAESILKRAGANLARVSFHVWATDRVWLRDSGPIFLKDAQGALAITDWKFNAWAKYEDWRKDDQVPVHVAGLLGAPRWQPVAGKHRLVLEGGSIDVNGAGTLITTEECLLSEVQQRNPGVSREELEAAFHEYLGIEQVLWMDRGVAGDDTHGHVDDLARFVASDAVVVASEDDRSDANYEPLKENYALLKETGLRVIKLPMPRPLVFAGRRLPASYANFYVANGLVLTPTFNDPADRVALTILAKCFPDREVTGINCTELIWGLGALHCMTQQQPAGV